MKRGILKNKSTSTTPNSSAAVNTGAAQVQFNEDNLAQIEAEKPATRMTIDEPKTPYHYANSEDYSDMDEMDLMDSDEAKQSSRSHRVVIIENDRMASNISDAAVSRRYSEWETSESEDFDHDRKDSEKFKIKRRQHYNEYQAVRRLRQIKPNFDEDEDDDDTLSAIMNSEILPNPKSNIDRLKS